MRVNGTVRVPGDKSISHRALMLSAIADGTTRIRGILESADVQSTAGVLRTLGWAIPDVGESMVVDFDASPTTFEPVRLRSTRT